MFICNFFKINYNIIFVVYKNIALLMKKSFCFLFTICLYYLSYGQVSIFNNVTDISGITYNGSSYSTAWGDINRDGYLDFFCTNHGKPYLYINNQGTGFIEKEINFFKDTIHLPLPYDEDYGVPYDMHGCNFSDINNDGYPDLYICCGADNGTGEGKQNLFFLNNNGTLEFKNKSIEFNLNDFFSRGRNSFCFDQNNDGLLDLFCCNLDRPNDGEGKTSNFISKSFLSFDKISSNLSLIDYSLNSGTLFYNTAKKEQKIIVYSNSNGYWYTYDTKNLPFVKEVKEQLPGLNSFAIGDFDGDGNFDIFGGTGYDKSEVVATDSFTIYGLFKPNINEYAINFKTDGEVTFAVDWFPPVGPLNNSIYIGSGGLHPELPIFTLNKDTLSHNGIKFHTPVFIQGIFAGYNSSNNLNRWEFKAGSSDPEALISFVIKSTKPITNIGKNFEVGETLIRDAFYIQKPDGKFNKVTNFLESGLNLSSCQGVVSGDFDNDMDLDLFITNSTSVSKMSNIYLENIGDGKFKQHLDGLGAGGENIGKSGTVTTTDYDNDGRLDLLIENGEGIIFYNKGPIQLYKNNNANRFKWIEISLAGTVSNREGIGAYIECYVGGSKQIRLRGSETNKYGQSSPRIHFGLGKSVLIDSIKIYWPSGNIQTLYNVKPNQILNIVESNTTTIIGGQINTPNSLNNYLLGLYPNPSKQIIHLTGIEKLGDSASVLIYNNIGSVVKSISDYVSNNPIDIEELPIGIYYIEISFKNNIEKQVLSFIKN